MFEERLAALEGAEDCVATASGMSAIMAAVLAHLKQGDHIVASNSLFGATVQLFNNILSRTGITTTFVSHTDPAAWAAAIRPETKRKPWAANTWANAVSLPFEAGLSNKGGGGNAGLVILTYIASTCSL